MVRRPSAREKIEEFYNKTKATRPPEIGLMKDRPRGKAWIEVGKNREYWPSNEAYKARTMVHTHILKGPETDFFSGSDLEDLLKNLKKTAKGGGGKRELQFPQKTIDAISIVHCSKNGAREAGRIIIRVPDKLKRAIAEKRDSLDLMKDAVAGANESRKMFLADRISREEHAEILKKIAEKAGAKIIESKWSLDTEIEEASLFKALLEKHGFQTRFQPMPGFKYDEKTMAFRPKK